MQLHDPVHFSRLHHMHKSPAHYRAAVLEPKAPSWAMMFGRIVHAIVFRQQHFVWDGERRGKAWQEYRAELPEDALVITVGERDRAMRCADAIGGNPEATRVLSGTQEVEREWRTLGRACAGRPDVANFQRNFVTELKSTTNAHPDTFQRGALRLGYHGQLPWYIDGVGGPSWDAFIVAVEISPPFAVTVLQLTPRTLLEGRKLYRGWMELLLNCEASNDWPAYCQSVVPFDLPDYAEPLLIDGEEVEAA